MLKAPANTKSNRNIWRIGLIVIIAGATASFPMVVASQGEGGYCFGLSIWEIAGRAW